MNAFRFPEPPGRADEARSGRRRPALCALVLGLLPAFGCSQRSPEVAADLAVVDGRPADGRSGESAATDQTVDCPVPAATDATVASGWKVVARLGVELRAVSCVEGHVFVAGDKGTLLHRTPGARLCGGFRQVAVPTSVDLHTVSFASLGYGVIGGKSPLIWESRDGGVTFAVAPQCGAVVFSMFHALHVHSETQGFGAGVAENKPGAAYKIFAGKTWICPDQTFANQTFYEAFRQGNGAWLSGDTGGLIYHTPDESTTWFYADLKTNKAVRGIHITRTLRGVAVGEGGLIARSTDGEGKVWEQVTTLGRDDLYDVFLWDDLYGWAVGKNGTILHSKDGGKTWLYQSANVAETLNAVCFISNQEGFAVGQGGTILYTKTAGE